MMGNSWVSIADYHNTEPGIIRCLCSDYLGELITYYDYKKHNGLSKKYSHLFNIEINSVPKLSMKNNVNAMLVDYDTFIEYSDELLINRYIRDWEKRYSVKWSDFIRTIKDSDNLENYLLLKPEYEANEISTYSLYWDYKNHGNDHTLPGHGSWSKRDKIEEDNRYRFRWDKDDYGFENK